MLEAFMWVGTISALFNWPTIPNINIMSSLGRCTEADIVRVWVSGRCTASPRPP